MKSEVEQPPGQKDYRCDWLTWRNDPDRNRAPLGLNSATLARSLCWARRMSAIIWR